MKDKLLKLRILRDALVSEFNSWLGSVWRKDLDSHYCCDGRECCCNGDTLRDIYSPRTTESPQERGA